MRASGAIIIARRIALTAMIPLFAACGTSASDGQLSIGATTSPTSPTSSTTGTPTTGDGDGTATSETTSTTTSSTTATAGETTGAKFDLGFMSGTGGTTPPVDACRIGGDMDGVGDCEMIAPPDSFMPDVQWKFMGEGNENQAITTPLVANMTDDNNDGQIDLCDVPDVIVPIYGAGPEQSDGHMYILDGATGDVKLKFPGLVNGYGNPAVGDIDGDGLPEVVTTRSHVGDIFLGHLVAFEHDGAIKWECINIFSASQVAVALADLDNDGDVEILAGNQVVDHLGTTLWVAPNYNGSIDIPLAADLDGDGDLEVLHGADAFHHDGTVYYNSPAGIGHPSVANLDDDPEPEVLLAGFDGISILEHDGTPKFINQKPTGDPSWWRPAAVHDIDGDGAPEILASSNNNYAVYRPDLSIVWLAMVSDKSGYAAGTAFDFLGSGLAEAMYADESSLYVYDAAGATLLGTSRASWTQAENPVVADVDNDGSAEIVIVSNGGSQPAVQVIRDVEDRWIQARRIWNQHAYHVTNVREDATIPQFQAPSWQLLNTFRTNAQIEGGQVCMPRPPN
jgi:hypothetical protein